MSRRSSSWSDERLQAWSQEHLSYGVRMLRVMSEGALLRGEPADSYGQHVYFACLESAITHFRVLAEFLFGKGRNVDDVTAEDFFRTALEWEQLRGPQPPEIAHLRNRASGEVAHLTARRIAGTPPEKSWALVDFHRLDPFLELFARGADPMRLDTTAINEIGNHFRWEESRLMPYRP